MKNLLILSSILLLITSCSKSIETIQPELATITESVYASGIVKSQNQYQVFSTVSGIVEEIAVKEGDLIKIDQPILKLKNVSGKLNAENARLAALLANSNANGDKLNELKLSIELAQLKLKNDSALYFRQKELWQQRIGTKNELEQRELAYHNSQTQYQSAMLRYNDAKKQFDILARQASNSMEMSSSMENDFTIKSQSNGRIYSLQKEKGELVTPQAPIAVIGDAAEFELELLVDEYDITKIKTDQKVAVTLDSYKGQSFEAKVTKIDPIMNERTRTFKVNAEFITKPAVLYPNLSVEANIIIQSKANALLIPRKYLINDSFVMNDKSEKIRVTTGLMDYQKAEILSGINKNDRIILQAK